MTTKRWPGWSCRCYTTTPSGKKIFEENGGCDFAYSLQIDDKRWRFRVNVMQQMGSLGLVARRVNNWIPDFKSLCLPDGMEKLCQYRRG